MAEYVQQPEWGSFHVHRAEALMRELTENGPMYPWTLVSRIVQEDEDRDEFRMDVLKPLVLNRYIRVNASGLLVVDQRRDFFQDYNVKRVHVRCSAHPEREN